MGRGSVLGHFLGRVAMTCAASSAGEANLRRSGGPTRPRLVTGMPRRVLCENPKC